MTEMNRYTRQVIFSGIGEEGQKKLSRGSVVVMGCGALGSVISSTLVRAGVGRVRVVDRDFVEYSNLHRQFLYDEDDVKSRTPKAVAARNHLCKINSTVEVEGVFAEISVNNIEELVRGADIILDALDNFETRFLVNDIAMKLKLPWIYGGVLGSTGHTLTVLPGKTSCLRCFMPQTPPSGLYPTTATAGVIGPAPFIVGSLESAEAMKILVGSGQVNENLTVLDVWNNTWRSFKVEPRKDCPACQGIYEFLNQNI